MASDKMGIKLKDVQDEVFTEERFETHQPKSNEKIEKLRDLVKDEMYDKFIEVYGGPVKTYERFLVARQWNVVKAEKMMRKCIQIRKEFKLDEERSMEELEELELKRKQIEPLWIKRPWGFAKEGNVVEYASLGKVKPNALLAIPEGDIKEYAMLQGLKVFRMQNYANSTPRRNSSEEEWKANIAIINLKGIGRAQMKMDGLYLLKRVLGTLQALAPELVAKSFIINAPWYFKGAWTIIKQALDKRVLAKITVSSGGMKNELVNILGSEELYNEMISSDYVV